MHHFVMPKNRTKGTSTSFPQVQDDVDLPLSIWQLGHMSHSTPVPPTITVHQAARALQVQPATVYAWIRNDEFPHLRLGGRIRIPTARLADLLGITPREIVDGLG